jgi:3-oxo-5-alpha-steroid 4-dehydrogenase 1
MSQDHLQVYIILGMLAVAVAVFVALFFVKAPYGRHLRQGWGPLVPNRLGWVIMESPAALVFAICFAIGTASKNLPLLLFFVLWELHYVHRAFIYPLTIRDGNKKMPVAVILMGFSFNLANTYANGRYLFSLSGGYPRDWLHDPRFLAGLILFLAGFIVNRWADLALRKLRKPGETGYRIPYGGLFRWISCPNYLGEIVEWFGWALMTWSLVGLVFAVWTFANLAPRARSHHAWYHAQFAEYPAERKALIPRIW